METVPTKVAVTETPDLGAAKSIKPPEPTESEMRAWRAQNFTVKHSTVIACGHKIDLRHMPSKSNCPDCWMAFFSVSPQGVAQVHQLLLEGGRQAVERIFGRKFVRWFGKFLQNKLLTEYASREVQAASGIEASIPSITEEREGN